jgi:16S rRNA U1498 N3-methylase RsmE
MSNAAKISSVENGITIDLGPTKDMYNANAPAIDLILAVPRPQKLEKLLPIVACLGVRNIFLVDASKVEKDYFGKIVVYLCTSAKEAIC